MNNQHVVQAGPIAISNKAPFVLIAGPCAMESRDHALFMAEKLVAIASELEISLIYKSSFDKANRTSISAKRGIGMEEALLIFEEVKRTFSCPVVTDVHLPDQCAPVAEVVDILQIPAYLCRQTDLLLAAGNTGRVVNIKKGQFLAPWDMQNVLNKALSTGNKNILLCERGTSFGYNTMVSDMRALPTMADMGYPVVFDATHSVQQPGGKGESSGGQREFVPVLARAAVAVGIAALFMETHDRPEEAFSDGPNSVPLDVMKPLLEDLKAIDVLIKSRDLVEI